MTGHNIDITSLMLISWYLYLDTNIYLSKKQLVIASERYQKRVDSSSKYLGGDITNID